MTVSVIVPTYNHRDYIVAALESVFAQTFTDYEVIVVNDGSPDDTEAVLKPFVRAGRIRYISQKNAGQAAARNRGLGEASGEFIAFLDDDDLWPAQRLETLVNTLRQNPNATLTYGRVQLVGPTAQPLTEPERNALALDTPTDGPSGDVWSAFLRRNYILSPGQTLIRGKLEERRETKGEDGVEFRFSPLWGVDDYDLWLRLAETGPFVFVPETVLHYRVHGTNASKNALRMHVNEMRLFAKHFWRHRATPGRAWSVLRAWQARAWRLAKYWIRQISKTARPGLL